MSAIINSMLLLGVIGFASGLFLSFVSEKFKVQEDYKLEVVKAILPGADCGSCGYPGCAGFARAFVKGVASKDDCTPGKAEGVPELLNKISKMSDDEINKIHEESQGDRSKIKELLAKS